MTSSHRAAPAGPHAGTRVLAWAVLAAAVLEVVAPLITINGPGSSPGGGSGPELLITPVGWAFSIWGVIYTLAIAQAVAALVLGPRRLPRRLQVDQVVLYLAGTAWIVLAGLDSSLATAAALTVMLVAAIDGILVATRHRIDPGWLRMLTRIAFGLYAGWVTAAFFLNASTAIVDGDLAEARQAGWQVVVLAAAVVTLLVVLVAARGTLGYAAAALWAMVGIAVTGATNGTTAAAVAALVGAAALVAIAIVSVRRSAAA